MAPTDPEDVPETVPQNRTLCLDCGAPFDAKFRWIVRCQPCGAKRLEPDPPLPPKSPQTTHEWLVAQLADEGWQVGRWRERTKRQIRDIGNLLGIRDSWDEAPLLLEDMENVTVIPDAWRIQVEGPGNDPHGRGWKHNVMVLEFAEVEVTHHMPEVKLCLYEGLWWRFDASEYAHFRLWRVDRTGHRSEFPVALVGPWWPVKVRGLSL